jgi:2-polyprenyl-6-methoxyphenol hydroxylase-like FAD-dependent oxidoreductase
MTHILIVGAGIGGLTTALCLHAIGARVTVAEAVEELRPLGVGINLLPHGAAVLHDLHLAQDLAATGIQTRALNYYTEFGQLILSDPRGLAAGLPVPQYSIHRGALQMLLLRAASAHLPPGSVRTGLRLVGIEQDAHGVRGRFVASNCAAETIAADGLVGADGNRSRAAVLLHDRVPPLAWNGLTMWRGAVESEPFLDGQTMLMAGHHERKAVVYPISAEARARGRSLTNWVAEVQTGEAQPLDEAGDWNRPAEADAFAGHFAGVCAPLIDLPALFRATPRILVYPMVDRDPLPAWTVGRATLLGDAAHPMWPVGSNGASQAILDADALAGALAEAGGEVPAAFAAYDAIRRPATAEVVRSNREKGPERVLMLAHERVHGPQDDVRLLISREELDRVTLGYRRIAGFDAGTLATAAAARAARRRPC